MPLLGFCIRILVGGGGGIYIQEYITLNLLLFSGKMGKQYDEFKRAMFLSDLTL